MTNTVSERISDETLSKAIQIESGGQPSIKALTSSATGLGQFINGTWLAVVGKHRPDVMRQYGNGVLALRTNPSFSIEMLARLWEESLDALGPHATEGDLYLAHFLGVSAAKNVFRAPVTDLVEKHVNPKAVQANPTILRGKTVGQVRDWAARKMNAAGGHGWVAKWYDANDPLVAETTQADTGDIHEDEVPTKVDDAEEEAAAPVTDPTPHGQVNNKIANLQKALVTMNYNEVGAVDGAWGGGTRAAIAAFLNDRGIDTVADMSPAVLNEIGKAQLEGFTRPMSQARANITPKELAKYNPTMLATLRTKAVAFWGAVSSVGLVAFNAVTSYFHSIWDMLAPVRKGLDSVPGWTWVALAGVGCVLLYMNAHRAEKDTTEAFQNRRLLR